MIVPCGQRIPLIKEFHDQALGGNLSADKVYHSLKRNFYWPHMKDLIQRSVTSCDLCQKNKSWHQKPYGALQLPDVPTTTWESVSLDFCGPFPRSKNGNELVLVVSDRLSRLQYLIPCPLAVTAILTANLFLKIRFSSSLTPKTSYFRLRTPIRINILEGALAAS